MRRDEIEASAKAGTLAEARETIKQQWSLITRLRQERQELHDRIIRLLRRNAELNDEVDGQAYQLRLAQNDICALEGWGP